MNTTTRVTHDLWKTKVVPATPGERIAISLLETTWTAPPDGADDSDRGLYVTTVPGTELRISPWGGWHAMEQADRRATDAYRVLARLIDEALAREDRP